MNSKKNSRNGTCEITIDFYIFHSIIMLLTKYTYFSMLQDFIESLLHKAEYTKDENWIILAEIPWYQGFFSQWEDIEEARSNLLDAIQWVITIKLIHWDKDLKKKIEEFLVNNTPKEYAQISSS